ncbi:PREDICTED: uncharacterized protein LOC105114883 isoform X2 [Populus euphratica]|uniref:Uncharacterized protein LOC105114883 isoform X1 n=1 Tax=Populus euphratica TaxID=75702 RepID=A0AAJ6TEU5_POPEU|nr:PREDICTED: uncharacterized protein LOC105114883 isoform X1 [Populus euphratica]XP_011009890.1 PREDICTED: uncharacterized protein LOC105114883 isoform X2 [Populus euphratica]
MAISIFAFLTSWLAPGSLFLFLNIMIATIALASRYGTHNKPVHEDKHLARAPSLLQRVKSIDYFSFYNFPPAQEPENTTQEHDPPQLERAPSLLQRVKSIDYFPFYKFPPAQEPENTTQEHDPPELERAPSLLERVKSINFSSLYYSTGPEETTQHPPAQTRSDADPGTCHDHDHDHHVKRIQSEHMMKATKRQVKMKKSASEKAVSLDLAEEVEREKVEERRPATAKASEKTVMIEDEEVDAKADDFINRFKQQLKLQRLESFLRYKEMLKGKLSI